MSKEKIEKLISSTSIFSHYKVGSGTRYETILTGVTFRPANMFFQKLFEGTKLSTSLPGSQDLFCFNDVDAVRKYILSQDVKKTISFSAKGIQGGIASGWFGMTKVSDLSDIFGSNQYSISFEEIKGIIDSQKVYLSPTLPKKFYLSLKKALYDDEYVVLPGNDWNPIELGEFKTKNCSNLIKEVTKNPLQFGFKKEKDFEDLLDLTIYQIGSMVIKTEDYKIFMDGNGKMIKRDVGENDSIQLISSCGIRAFYKTDPRTNKAIMTNTFKTAIVSSQNGHLVFPAVGMGVWRGDPNIYWRAFLDAVVESGSSLKSVFVNPGHAPTPGGICEGCKGEEFQMILDEYLSEKIPCDKTNLKKIFNLYDQKTDVVQLAYNLKKEFPEEIVALYNASDPDVTLGNHVGEYTNNCPHTSTTEENYTAMGTNGLCFEQITKVLEDDQRVIEVKFEENK